MIHDFNDVIKCLGENAVNQIFNHWCEIALDEDYNSFSPSVQEAIYKNFQEETMTIINAQEKKE